MQCNWEWQKEKRLTDRQREKQRGRSIEASMIKMDRGGKVLNPKTLKLYHSLWTCTCKNVHEQIKFLIPLCRYRKQSTLLKHN